VQAAGIVALVVGVIMVARAPVLSHIRTGPAKSGHGGPKTAQDQGGRPRPASPTAAPSLPVPPLPVPPPPPVPVPVPPGSAAPDPAAALRPAAGGAR
jgi:hypothetical protein